MQIRISGYASIYVCDQKGQGRNTRKAQHKTRIRQWQGKGKQGWQRLHLDLDMDIEHGIYGACLQQVSLGLLVSSFPIVA